MGKVQYLFIVCGNRENWCILYVNKCDYSSKKPRKWFTIWFSYITLGRSQRILYPTTEIFDYPCSFILAREQEQPICLSTDEWIIKICTFIQWKNYSPVKEDDMMKIADQWVELEIIILSKVTQKRKYHIFSYGNL